MKQAILITAYKNVDHLVRITEFFTDDFVFYIHFDQKSKDKKEAHDRLTHLPKVKEVSSKYKVNWGGRNHLLSILHLAFRAMEDPEIGYFHLITGQDYPIKPVEEFRSFFEHHRDRSFMEHFPMPAACWHEGGMNRIERYNFYDWFDAKKSIRPISRLLRIQHKLGIKRKYGEQLPPLYGGSTYWSLNRAAVEVLQDYTLTKPKLLRRMKHSFCAEEIYIQTVLMHSAVRDQINTDNLRYIKWEEDQTSSPAILDESHLEALYSSSAFFARKFENPQSDSLLKELTAPKHNDIS